MDYKEKVIAMLNSKELSQEQKEKLENIFPELTMSEDEKMKDYIKDVIQAAIIPKKENKQKMIAWLEKQKERSPLLKDEEYTLARIIEYLEENDCPSEWKDLLYDVYALPYQKEQKPADKVEPKFHPGNWIVDDETPNDVFCVIEVLGEIYKVIDIDGDDYHIPHCKADKQFHLWSISDARDGDVLVGKDGRPFIFTGKFDVQDDNPIAHCGINSSNKFRRGCSTHWTFKDGVKPSTKEQRDLLFSKMKEAGYKWDSEKKELKKIEPKTLNADEVIEWLKTKVYDDSTYGRAMIEQFKKDFDS